MATKCMKLLFEKGLEIETEHPELFTVDKNGWSIIGDPNCKVNWKKLKEPMILKVGRKAVRIVP